MYALLCLGNSLTPQIYTSVDTYNWFLLIIINIIAFLCTEKVKGNAHIQKKAANRNKRRQQTCWFGQCHAWYVPLWSVTTRFSSYLSDILFLNLLFLFLLGKRKRVTWYVYIYTSIISIGTTESSTYLLWLWFGEEEEKKHTELKSLNLPQSIDAIYKTLNRYAMYSWKRNMRSKKEEETIHITHAFHGKLHWLWEIVFCAVYKCRNIENLLLRWDFGVESMCVVWAREHVKIPLHFMWCSWNFYCFLKIQVYFIWLASVPINFISSVEIHACTHTQKTMRISHTS